MKTRNTIILVGVFLSLLAYVYFFEVAGEKKRKDARKAENKFLKINKDKLVRIVFSHSNIKIEKKDGFWKIIEPVETRADLTALLSSLNSFDSIYEEMIISDNPADFEKFGLNSFETGIVFYWKDGMQDSIFFGDDNFDGTEVFCRTSRSNNIYLVDISFLHFAQSSYFDLQDKSILVVDENNIRKLLIKRGRQSFSCIKDSADTWWMDFPVKIKCDQKKVNAIIKKLSHSKIVQFVDVHHENSKNVTLNSPWLSVSVFEENGASHLDIWDKEEKHYLAKREKKGPIFTVDSIFVNELDVSFLDLKDKTIVQSLPDSVPGIPDDDGNNILNFL